MLGKLVICLLFAACLSSQEWYVSKQRGSDENSGTKESPFATIRKAYLKTKDGDQILIEPAAYSEDNRIEKSIRIRGIGGRPVVRGSFTFKGAHKCEISDIDMETTTTTLIYADRVDYLKIYNMDFGPKYQKQGHAIQVVYSKMVEIANIKVHEVDVGISISSTQFSIKNAEITKSKVGMSLGLNSKGVVDNSTISHCEGSYNVMGGGISVNGDIALRNVNLLYNTAGVYKKTGGGFYCGGGGLNIFGGKIIGNKAQYGAAGECEQSCSIFISGTEFKDNEGEYASKCRGVPSKK